MINHSPVIAGTAALLIATAAFATGREMSVEVGTAEIRTQPSSFSSIVATAKYGDRFTVGEQKSGYTKITTADQKTTGWIATSSLTKTKIVLAASGKNADLAASSDEVALAGKGFNAEVEKQYRVKHANIDFTWIDKMEKVKIPTSEVLKFLREGGISVSEGGAK